MNGLTPEQWELVKAILKGQPGKVLLFGSRVSGTQREDSDLDVCIKPDSGKVPLLLLNSLRDKFENSNLPFVVDIVDYGDLPEAFQQKIDMQGFLLSTV